MKQKAIAMSFDQLDSKDECLRTMQWSNQLAKVEYYTDQLNSANTLTPEDKSYVADLTFDLSDEASKLLGLTIEEYSHSIGG